MFLTDAISYTTIRIESTTFSGEIITGTGFFFSFCKDGKSFCPAIVTNKHVIQGISSCKLVFTLADKEGNPLDSINHTVNITDASTPWKLHPDPNVDLCAIPIATIFNIIIQKGFNVYYESFNMSHLLNSEQQFELQAMEDVLMVGYPNGLWDDANNKPIFRKGITATHPNKDYKGEKLFLIDAAVYPGSSGSPIILYNCTTHFDGIDFKIQPTRIKLLGILFAGYQHSVYGKIQEISNIPVSLIPNNLGLVIKAERLLYFEELFRKELDSKINFIHAQKPID